MFHIPLSPEEKHLIQTLRAHTNFSWQMIADELNTCFKEYNKGTRHRDTIYQYMVRRRKEERAQMIADLRQQGLSESEVAEKVNQIDTP